MYRFMRSTKQVKGIRALVIVLTMTLLVFPIFGLSASPAPSATLESEPTEEVSNALASASANPEGSPAPQQENAPTPTVAAIATPAGAPTASVAPKVSETSLADEVIASTPPQPSVTAENNGLGEIETIEDEPIPEGVDQDIQWFLVIIMIIIMGSSGGFSWMLWQKRKVRDGYHWRADN